MVGKKGLSEIKKCTHVNNFLGRILTGGIWGYFFMSLTVKIFDVCPEAPRLRQTIAVPGLDL